MELKLLNRSVSSHGGYGAGSGETIREEYECPCGKGLVIYEKDDIPGFRDTSIFSDCEDCKTKYELDRGTAREKINK